MTVTNVRSQLKLWAITPDGKDIGLLSIYRKINTIRVIVMEGKTPSAERNLKTGLQLIRKMRRQGFRFRTPFRNISGR